MFVQFCSDETTMVPETPDQTETGKLKKNVNYCSRFSHMRVQTIASCQWVTVKGC